MLMGERICGEVSRVFIWSRGCWVLWVGWMVDEIDGLDGMDEIDRLGRRRDMWIGIPSFDNHG